MGEATENVRLATFDCYGTLIDWEDLWPLAGLGSRV